MKYKRKIILIIIFFLFGLIIYSFFIEPNVLKTENQIFKLNCLGLNSNKKFIQISDLHFNGFNFWTNRKINQIYQVVKNFNPNAIFITGDLISQKQGIEPVIKLIEKLSQHSSVFVVFGNWDYWALNFNIKKFKKQLENAGANVLINEVNNFNEINIIGIKDPYTSDNIERDLNNAKEKIEKEKKQNCKLLLAHSPDIFEQAIKQEIDLVLVGHTHGGQFFIPFITEKIIPLRYKSNKAFIKGFYEKNKTQMYVNRGIGGSVLNIRFLIPPEITLITLEIDKNKNYP